MKYKLEVEVKIIDEDCEEFEELLKGKAFDFFRYLADNNAKIKIVEKSK